ncbi:MAG TPA: helix-turn-helix transcriptional regulator [Vicinamibacterales bacterium]|jgi:PadR family transcriptional regulator PadR|nr:helix-turn-helix transcriptional regulator [Vicinamibacterales bacterium]
MRDLTPIGEFEQLVLLAVLRLAEDADGVRIAAELEARAGRRVSRGALYTTLDRLETKGLVRWKLAAGSPERRNLPRRAYSLTARGVAAIRQSRLVLQRMWSGLDELLKDRP